MSLLTKAAPGTVMSINGARFTFRVEYDRRLKRTEVTFVILDMADLQKEFDGQMVQIGKRPDDG